MKGSVCYCFVHSLMNTHSDHLLHAINGEIFFYTYKILLLWLASSYFKAMQFSYLVENLWINLDVRGTH